MEFFGIPWKFWEFLGVSGVLSSYSEEFLGGLELVCLEPCYTNFLKGLIRLALMDSDKLDKPAHAKSYIVDTSPKCAENIFEKDGCSSFLIKSFLKKS